MASLRGHATDSPGRWKEPRAFAAADHTSQRARQGRGRRSIRRRVSGQCACRRGPARSLIPHARAIRALVIPMIEPAFWTATMALARSADRGVAGRRATCRTSNTHGHDHTTSRSRRVGYSAGRFSGEAVRPRRRSGIALRLDTTRQTMAQQRRLARSVGASRRSPRAWRDQLQVLTSDLPRPSAYATRARSPKPKRLWTLPQRWTHRTRPPLLGNLAEEREIPTAPTALFFFLQKRRTKNTYDDACPDLRGFK